MCKVKNEISDFTKGLIAGNHGRAILISELISSCEKHGIEVDSIADDCFFKLGAEASKGAHGDGPEDFIRFMTAANVELFDKEIIKLDPEHSVARFHYCPLYAAWKEMGLPTERIEYLCDVASKADYGRASNFKNTVLSFPKKLAYGDDYCELDAKLVE